MSDEKALEDKTPCSEFEDQDRNAFIIISKLLKSKSTRISIIAIWQFFL
jgi:hypothetical protein